MEDGWSVGRLVGRLVKEKRGGCAGYLMYLLCMQVGVCAGGGGGNLGGRLREVGAFRLPRQVV